MLTGRDKWCVVTYINFLSLSTRSEERQVRSTENLSRFTFRIRQCTVIPTYQEQGRAVRGGEERKGVKGGGRRGEER